MFKKIIKKMALYLGIFLMFGILLFPNLRSEIGKFVGTILNPLLDLFPPEKESYIIIFLLAAITGLYASLIQKYTMDWNLMRRVQEKMKTMQTEFKEAQLANNAQKMKKLEAQRAEMMGDQMEMMKQQFKPMLYISIISIPLFFWAYTVITPEYFSWNDIPINDSSKLITFLEKTQSVEWVKNATIEKSSDGGVITVSDPKNLLSLSLNEEKTKVLLKTEGDKTQEFNATTENGKLNIYAPPSTMIFPFWGKQHMNATLFGPFQYWLFWYFLCSIPVSQMTRKALNIGGM
ncbi:MAG: EMC3/TMCO1 family protein [Candidatus Methanoperedens sp.]|nr:EMC3/TMCO1 family protein [Candidatus Methanoperedens sp.]MCZ7371243.1 EMC3/TMCO1 family protein [Candidatus Methanoperedens sp.]